MSTTFDAAVAEIRSGADVHETAVGLVAQLTDAELLWTLDGDMPQRRGLAQLARRYNGVPIEAGRIDRLGIPGIRFTDGPRGIVMGASTAFPVALARAATWDPGLEGRVGEAIGQEGRALSANLFAGVCVNLAPFPGWGRSQESFGEEPLLLAAMGSALSAGVQPWLMSCVKHYALNSMEDARFVVDVEVEEDVLREVYLPHFEQVVGSGVDSVMSAYNKVRGLHAGENPYLLTDVLRDDWGFDGFVMSDFVWGIRDPLGSLVAGCDLEMPVRQQRARVLPAALRDGRLPRSVAQRSAARILAAQLRWAARAEPAPPQDVGHGDLAREVAARSAVLLRNELDGRPLLPLPDGTSLAVLGRLADRPNLGDHGSSRVRPPSVTTVLEALRARGPVVSDDTGDVAVARRLAQQAEVAVVVVGLDEHDEGESPVAMDPDALTVLGSVLRIRPVARLVSWLGSRRSSTVGGDRHDLRLHARDVELIEAVSAVNPRTVVVLIGGGTIVVDPWDAGVAALLLAWYPGMAGGDAIADLLFGDAQPTGRLPLAIPHRAADLPQVNWRTRRVRYGRLWGQRALDRAGVAAAYPLGFGLGFTTFALGGALWEDGAVTVVVTNTGQRDGRHVVQVYAVRDAVRTLVGFAGVGLGAGESQRVTVPLSTWPLRRWDGTRLVLDPGELTLEVGAYSGDPRALVLRATLP